MLYQPNGVNPNESNGSGVFCQTQHKGNMWELGVHIYGNRCLQLFLLAQTLGLSPFLKADGKYYDADDEREKEDSHLEYKSVFHPHSPLVNERNTDRKTVRRFRLDIFKRFFRESIFHVTVKQNICWLYPVHIGINTRHTKCCMMPHIIDKFPVDFKYSSTAVIMPH